LIRSHLKKIFWPKLGVGPSLQVLDILEYTCGLKLGPALILNQNLFFEMASISRLKKIFWPKLGVGPSLQVLDILEYACGLKLGPALILNQNLFFEMASRS